MRHILTTAAVIAAVAAAVTVPARATSSSHATAAAQGSVNVAVVPGFTAPVYPGFKGVPPFPAYDPSLAQYHFTQLSASAVTAAALQQYDTVVLYGLRWASLSPSAQAAIDQFALTGKVLIWDADSTGAQSYSNFVHPFSTSASGEVTTKQTGSVVTFPSGANPLASSNSSSPLFLDPAALTSSNHLVQDMSVMNPSPADWNPALVAANHVLPSGGWILAWAYGSTTDRTGMVVYSGMDADAFLDNASPNYAVKELGIELGAQFDRTPASCAPNCSGSGGSGGSGGGSGLGAPGGTTFAQCAFGHKLPTGWVRGKIAFSLKLAIASGIRSELRTTAGKLLASTAAQDSDGTMTMALNTKSLPSNRASALQVLVYVNSAKACTLPAKLSVDNIAPRVLKKSLKRHGGKWTVVVKSNEAVHVQVWSRTKLIKIVPARAGKAVTITLRAKPVPAAVILSDRAGNHKYARLKPLKASH